jgi:NitT/TauT family transport system ATP-binding protein
MTDIGPSSPLLQLDDVVVRYRDSHGKLFTVLNDIDFKVSAGEFVTVIGPSGCGKSTLLRMILGSEQPLEGTVQFEGHTVTSPDRNRGIVFQKYSLFPHLTVLDNLVFGLDMEQFSIPGRILTPFKFQSKKREFRDEAREYLKRVGLAEHEDKYPHQLSGGMRQRVAIAQSLIMKPKILLMDEPFGALDYSTRQDMQVVILEQWQQANMTIFFVTHDLEEAVFLGTRAIILTQYYETDAPTTQGSKIVTDISLPGPHPKPTAYKYSDEMGQLVKKLREDGLEPDHRRHIRDFDLSHKDSFRTVSPEEWKQ